MSLKEDLEALARFRPGRYTIEIVDERRVLLVPDGVEPFDQAKCLICGLTPATHAPFDRDHNFRFELPVFKLREMVRGDLWVTCKGYRTNDVTGDWFLNFHVRP